MNGEENNAYMLMVSQTERDQYKGQDRLVDNITTNPTEIGRGGMDWIYLA
jgi:hypothetical protein